MDKEKEHTYQVTKGNELIQRAAYNLTATEQKLLCYVISKIKPTDDKFEQYTISAADFADVCGINRKHIYDEFRKMVESFRNKSQWITIGDNQIYFSTFSEAEYNQKQGSITVMLNSRLRKYLLDLKRNYTSYELWNIVSLKSKYSIRLYELFISYKYFKGYGEYEKQFEIEEIKKLLCAESYTLYANFKVRVLDKAVEEINKYTNLNVKYKTIKGGKAHKVTAIIFILELKQPMERITAYYETIDKINKKTGQIKGQISIFDYEEEKRIKEEQ